MYLLVDVDSAFVEFERKRNPSLRGKPVAVTAGDAAVVAISKEAKRLGLKRGEPLFKLKERLPADSPIIFIPADHHWYKQASDELMAYLRSQAPQFWQYSIDEAFMDMSGVNEDLKTWGERLSERVRQTIGVSVSIGVAPTKTLAKMASHFAKRYPAYRHCCVIDTAERRTKALLLTPISEVWGIGPRHQALLQKAGIFSAYDLTLRDENLLVHDGMPQTILATRRELCGEDCIPMRKPGPKKSISSTATLPKMVDTLDELIPLVSNFAADCAAGLRQQHTVARDLSVFIATNPYRKDLLQYSRTASYRFATPTNLSNELCGKAIDLLRALFRQGFRYKRVGVTVTGVLSEEGVQTSLFDYDAQRHGKLQRLNHLMDDINSQAGSHLVVLGSQLSRQSSDDSTDAPELTKQP
jgi:DNA polymerase V